MRNSEFGMTVVLADLNDSAHQAAILELLDMYSRDQFGAGRPLSAETRANLIQGLMRHGGSRVYLAYEGNEPVGLAICFTGFSSFRAKPLINIHDIAVGPKHRGRGIGKLLLEAIEKDARAQGCCKVTLEVRADNFLAQGVYRSAGFKSTEPETWFWTQSLD
jgi:ribosomal protein S18 acetylase RimI-like enzyme